MFADPVGARPSSWTSPADPTSSLLQDARHAPMRAGGAAEGEGLDVRSPAAAVRPQLVVMQLVVARSIGSKIDVLPVALACS